jgi:hypothetical protein
MDKARALKFLSELNYSPSLSYIAEFRDALETVVRLYSDIEAASAEKKSDGE